MDRSEVAIVIPAFNEAESIQFVISGVSEFGRAVVVDDCSTDGTSAAAAAAGAIVVRHDRNLGYDGALNSGFAEADRLGCKYGVTIDADGQHSPDLLKRFVSLLRGGHELVIGVRDAPARASEALFGWYTRMRFGLSDPLCGLKGYHINVYNELGHFDSYTSIGTELMLFGLRKRRNFATVPVPIAPRRHGESRFAQNWRGDKRILRALVLALIR